MPRPESFDRRSQLAHQNRQPSRKEPELKSLADRYGIDTNLLSRMLELPPSKKEAISVPGREARTGRQRPDPDEERFKKQLRSLERKIEKVVKKADLDVLEKAGVPRSTMVTLLALTVSGDVNSFLFAEVRSAIVELKSLSDQLETAARDLAKALKNPCNTLWFPMYLLTSFQRFKRGKGVSWKADPLARLMPSGMRTLARNSRLEAERLGTFLRAFARRDSRPQAGLLLLWVLLFRRMKDGTIQEPDHLDVISSLLNDALDAVGGQGSAASKYFTKDSLRGVWRRGAKNILVLLIRAREPVRQHSKHSPIMPIARPPLVPKS